jgi:hypothetical protein
MRNIIPSIRNKNTNWTVYVESEMKKFIFRGNMTSRVKMIITRDNALNMSVLFFKL